MKDKTEYELNLFDYIRILRRRKWTIFLSVIVVMAVTFFSKYTKKPLHFFGTLGLVCVILGFIGGLYFVILKLLGADIGNRPLLILTTKSRAGRLVLMFF